MIGERRTSGAAGAIVMGIFTESGKHVMAVEYLGPSAFLGCLRWDVRSPAVLLKPPRYFRPVGAMGVIRLSLLDATPNDGEIETVGEYGARPEKHQQECDYYCVLPSDFGCRARGGVGLGACRVRDRGGPEHFGKIYADAIAEAVSWELASVDEAL